MTFEPDKAMADASKALAYDSRWRKYVHIIQCIALAGKHQYEQAYNEATRALDLAPKTASTFALRAHVELEMNRFDEALADCNDGITAWSDGQPVSELIDVLQVRAMVHAYFRDLDRAKEDIGQAIDLHPDHPNALIDRAFVYSINREFAKALADLAHCTKVAKSKCYVPYVEIVRARIAIAQNDLDEAITHCANAGAIAPNMYSPLSLRALALLRSERYDEAEELLDRAILLNPNDGESFCFRHELHECLGNKEKAERDKSEAAKLRYKPYL
jgi:tetratricopeptide (TPR) repeat protein